MLDKKLTKNSQKQASEDIKINKLDKDTNFELNTKITPTKSSNLSKIKMLCQKLDKLPKETKIRIISRDYELWRDFLPHYNKYKEKFFVFRDKKDFLINAIKDTVTEKKEQKSLKESLIKFMQENKIEKKIRDILLEEIK